MDMLDAIRETREAMWANGFRPIPVETAKKGDKDSGKRPLGDKWQIGARLDPPACLGFDVVAWGANTGILADGLRVVDFDIDDPRLVAAVTAEAVNILGMSILRTRAGSPRCMMVYRSSDGEPKKLAITGSTHSKDVACKIEVLGLGQQFVAHGQHWTGAELQWPGGGPCNTKRDSLPAVSEKQIGDFLAACTPIIDAKPITPKPTRKKTNGGGSGKDESPTADQGDLFAALNVIPNDSPPDWEAWNNIGMAIWAATEGSDAGLDMWMAWSAKHPADDPEATLARWDHYATSPPSNTGAGKIFALAVSNSPGWRKPSMLRDTSMPPGDVLPPGAPPIDPPVDIPTDDGPPGGEPPPPDEPPGEPDPKLPEEIPTIICADGEIVGMVHAAEDALVKATHLAVFQRGALVQPHQNEYFDAENNVTHSAGFAPMTSTALMLLLARSANFVKWDGRLNGGQGGFKRINPPDKLVETILFDRVGWPFDTVRGVLSCPTMRPDGSILREPGYDPATRYYLMFPSNLVIPEIPDKPSKNDAREALLRLLALLESYPFVNKQSQAVALCILMTQVLRCAMPISPMLAVSAKAPGTGKSHLVDLGSAIAIGRTCPSMGAGKDEKETEKEINTMLLSGVPGFSIDNVSRDVESDLLNRATSQTRLMIRVFTKLENIEVENAVVIFMTGNNLAVINEQRRRTVRCEMDAGLENPERREFEVDPINTVMANRGRYIADVLTIARAYHVSGASVAPYPYNGFSAWSHFVREPLIWLGQADPCDTMEGTAKDDPSTVRLQSMVEGWSHEFDGQFLTAAQAVQRANADGFYQVLKEQFPAKGGSEVDTTRMGNWLRKFAGRPSNGKRFVRDDGNTGGTVRWKIEYL
jgi:hypothetical protein